MIFSQILQIKLFNRLLEAEKTFSLNKISICMDVIYTHICTYGCDKLTYI